MNEADELLRELYEDVEGMEYDVEDEKFTIEILDDIGRMMELYRTNPIARQFVQHELAARKTALGYEDSPITDYEIAGFFWRHRGESFTAWQAE